MNLRKRNVQDARQAAGDLFHGNLTHCLVPDRRSPEHEHGATPHRPVAMIACFARLRKLLTARREHEPVGRLEDRGRISGNIRREPRPGETVVRVLATRYLDDSVESDPNWPHITHCSPCYGEFLRYRAEMKRAAWVKRMSIGAGLAAVAAMLIGGILYVTQRPGPTSRERPQITELVYRPRVVDLEGWSSTRSEDGKEPAKPIQLGRGPEELTIRLPFASKAGTYDVQLLKAVDQPLVSTSGEAQVLDGGTLLKTRVDLSKLAPGRYLLGVRRLPADWTFYPSEVR